MEELCRLEPMQIVQLRSARPTCVPPSVSRSNHREPQSAPKTNWTEGRSFVLGVAPRPRQHSRPEQAFGVTCGSGFGPRVLHWITGGNSDRFTLPARPWKDAFIKSSG